MGMVCGSVTTCTASLRWVPASVRLKPDPSSRRRRSASGPLPGRAGAVGQLVAPAQPAGPRQVEDQVQPLGGDVDELAVPGDVVDLQAPQGRERRVVGLQRAERGELDVGDGVADAALAQEPRERLDLGHLRHGSSVPGVAGQSGAGRVSACRSRAR